MNQMNLFEPSSHGSDEPSVSAGGSLWHLFVDGASRNNPGNAGAGIYIVKNGKFFFKHGFYLGIRTNNEAEYYALLIGLFFIQKHFKADDALVVISDSLLVVRQVEGIFKIKKKELIPLRQLAFSLMRHCNNGGIQHVLRHDNVHADEMANEGVDKKIAVPQEFIDMLSKHGITF